MPLRNKATTASVRWKWGTRLTVAFLLFFGVFTAIMLNTVKSKLLDERRIEAQEFVQQLSTTIGQLDTRLTEMNMESLMNKISVSTISKGNVRVKNLPLLEKWTEEGTFIQIFDADAELLYESQAIHAPFQRVSSFTFNETPMNSRVGFIGRNTIVSESDSVLMGYIQVTFRLTDYHERMADINQSFFLIFLAGSLIIVLLGYGLSQWFFRPIKVMADTMNEINEDTLSTRRIEVKNPNQDDELTDLSKSINSLLDKMGIYITQQKQFVEDVSHELRTPTAVVEGHLKLLNRWGKDDPEILEESLQASLSEIVRMKNLVQEMLDLSRAEQVQMHYPNEVTPAGEVVSQVFHNFKVLHPDFSFHLDNDLSHERFVKIYRNHFEQILVILVDNAVKYSRDRKEIHLSVSETLSKVQVSIQDFGEGMTKEDQQKIFNRFYRVDKARSREKGGHGLGLSIAKELIENYKGDISVESVLGQGTIFRIQLPFTVKEQGEQTQPMER